MNDIPFRSRTARFQILLVFAACVWVLGALLAWPRGLIGDEWVHFHQIDRFRTGDARVLVNLTTIPGFHWLIAGTLQVLNADSLGAARLINAMLGVGSVGLFHLVRRQLHAVDAIRATAQFSVLPILVPFAFLAYTDVAALMLVLAAIYASELGKHRWSALLLLGSISMRQNNVVWVPLLALWSVWPSWQASGWRPWLCWKQSFRVAWPYAAPVVVFLGYWLWRGTISFSTSQAPMHPDGALHVGNPFFALALLTCLLPVQTLHGVHAFTRRARTQVRLWLVPVACFVVFAVFFQVDHPYNFLALGSNLRNVMLMSVATHDFVWLAFGLVATAGACGIVGNGFVTTRAWLFWPIAFLCLGASWLIEPRYSLIPMAIYLLFRRPDTPSVENFTLMLWSVLSVSLLLAIFGHGWMI